MERATPTCQNNGATSLQLQRRNTGAIGLIAASAAGMTQEAYVHGRNVAY